MLFRSVASDLCSDEEFLRRVSLDITGTMPTMSEYDAFMADTDPAKRDKLVDALLGRKEFVDMWVMKWAELLQVRTIANRVEKKPMLAYYNWLKDRIASNTPTDKMVQELLGARGGSFSSPATNYYQTETETLKVAENVAQVFMGMRMQCAQCHNHKFDPYTARDFYSLVAFFADLDEGRRLHDGIGTRMLGPEVLVLGEPVGGGGIGEFARLAEGLHVALVHPGRRIADSLGVGRAHQVHANGVLEGLVMLWERPDRKSTRLNSSH